MGGRVQADAAQTARTGRVAAIGGAAAAAPLRVHGQVLEGRLRLAQQLVRLRSSAGPSRHQTHQFEDVEQHL